MIVQAIHDPGLGLMQIPGFSSAEVIKEVRQKRLSIKTPWDLKGLTKEELGFDLVSFFIRELSSDISPHVGDLMVALRRFPRIVLVKPHFKVLEHKDIPIDSLVTAYFFLAIAWDGAEEQAAKKLSLLSETECEAHLSRLLQRTSSFAALPAVHAPAFPGTKLPAWWALLSQQRSGMLQCMPVKISNIPQVAELVESKVPLEPVLVMQFPAPSHPGSFALGLELKCDSLMNTDFHCDIKLNIVPGAPDAPLRGKQIDTDSDDDF